jgi:hypothetical protein
MNSNLSQRFNPHEEDHTMSTYLEQITRMREARTLDESPLVAAFNRVGIDAYLNTEGGAKENRSQGDVILRRSVRAADGFLCFAGLQGVESQVSRKHEQFSYSASKLGGYVGTWVYLACLERRQAIPMNVAGLAPAMIHVILARVELDDVLRKMPSGVYLSRDKKYYTIYPTELTTCSSAVFGSTIDEVVLKLIASPAWRIG